MPGPKTQTAPKPRVAIPSAPDLTGTTRVTVQGDDDSTFRELSLGEMAAPGETEADLIARQESEGMHMAFLMERDVQATYWAPRLGMTRLEYEREMRLHPEAMQQRMMEMWQHEEDMRDSGQAADQQDSLGYEKLSAASMYNAYAAGNLKGQERITQLARALLPKGLMGRFTPMLDKPRNDGYITGWSFIHNAAVPQKRREGRRFFTEVDPSEVKFLPEPTIPCEMRDGFGERCEKWLYTPEQLDIHQMYKHNREWAQTRERATQEKAASVANAQLEAAAAQRETAEAMREMVAAMRQPQPAPVPTPEAPVQTEEG